MTMLNYLFAPFMNTLYRLVCFMYTPRQAELNDMHMQAANGKVPPAWDPAADRRYPFRHWTTDVRLWSAATDLPEGRQGAAVALRLLGAAKLLVREFDPGTSGRHGHIGPCRRSQRSRPTQRDTLERTRCFVKRARQSICTPRTRDPDLLYR